MTLKHYAEVTKTQKNAYYMNPYTYNMRTGKTNL